LSKSRALAGLRVGWAMGHALLIDALERVKNSFNSYPLDVLAQHAAVASIEDDDHFVQTCQRVIDTRARLSLEMSALGFEVLPSAANFIFVRHRVRPAGELFAALRERGIIVRYFDKPRINNYLRITIGTNPQCDTLLAALQELLG
ncbi:MAG: aminotransferase class I/II-fold pyridoxal phosphate-dependent enzyme, partial [Halioglobus sp.]